MIDNLPHRYTHPTFDFGVPALGANHVPLGHDTIRPNENRPVTRNGALRNAGIGQGIPTANNTIPNNYGYQGLNGNGQFGHMQGHGSNFKDLFELSMRASQFEAILQEGEQLKNKSVGTYYQDTEGDIEIDVAQIYVGAKVIYEGIDLGIFVQMKSNYWYGLDDDPFLFRGNPVVPPRPGVPSYHDLEAVGYQFPSQGRYPNHRGAGFRRGVGQVSEEVLV
ncbi:hypothetical protein RHMOL_Rhmol11G0009900 [Rhododendron molle]|uniref:Uncharacterized protein n=1 Tax=Rhododendron molle TaxID=49168 RepID=A0ACC0LMX8_RHOML|nr:hypothetical protein RHMOL_Rhmol11G0009900 [Rhododendron molle]